MNVSMKLLQQQIHKTLKWNLIVTKHYVEGFISVRFVARCNCSQHQIVFTIGLVFTSNGLKYGNCFGYTVPFAGQIGTFSPNTGQLCAKSLFKTAQC